jgi:glyoxylase-like metal-dependent hydrolase (beta-lactamase superfamily II)
MDRRPRSVLAPNASAMTMEGTTTYIVGRRRAVVIDPGSADPRHLDALADAVADAGHVEILLTHDHPDHIGGAPELAARLDARVLGPGGEALADGAGIVTDEGTLLALATPGHTPDHLAFHWPDVGAIFCGDLMMGGIDTAVVAHPEGDVGDYLDSLLRLRRLAPNIIYPSHGPAFTDPADAIGRYVRHREERQAQVLVAVATGARTPEEIADSVYGAGLEPGLRGFAVAAVRAYLSHLRRTGRLQGDTIVEGTA